MKTTAISPKLRQKLAILRLEARNRASFDRDLRSNPAPVSNISAAGPFVCRTTPGVGIAPPPTKSKATPDDRGHWSYAEATRFRGGKSRGQF